MGKTKKKQIVKEENPTKELKGICVVIGKMTPELAVAMLRKNPRCDDLDEERIQRYAREMKAGRWILNNTSGSGRSSKQASRSTLSLPSSSPERKHHRSRRSIQKKSS